MQFELRGAGCAALALGALLAAPSANAANLITNGYFNQPDPSTYNQGGGAWNLAASIPGWTSNTTDEIETGLNGTYGLPSYLGSTTNLELNANTFGSISQTVTGLVIGQTYDLTFGYGSRGGAGDEQMDVFFGGNRVVEITQFTVPTSGWFANSYDITATSTSEVLTFTSNDIGGNPAEGNELTAVSLTAVPEPAAWALMLAGFGGLGGALRMSRRRTGVISPV